MVDRWEGGRIDRQIWTVSKGRVKIVREYWVLEVALSGGHMVLIMVGDWETCRGKGWEIIFLCY